MVKLIELRILIRLLSTILLIKSTSLDKEKKINDKLILSSGSITPPVKRWVFSFGFIVKRACEKTL